MIHVWGSSIALAVQGLRLLTEQGAGLDGPALLCWPGVAVRCTLAHSHAHSPMYSIRTHSHAFLCTCLTLTLYHPVRNLPHPPGLLLLPLLWPLTHPSDQQRRPGQGGGEAPHDAARRDRVPGVWVPINRKSGQPKGPQRADQAPTGQQSDHEDREPGTPGGLANRGGCKERTAAGACQGAVLVVGRRLGRGWRLGELGRKEGLQPEADLGLE